MTIEHNGKPYQVTVSYDKGGMNYFSGSTIARGYHFHLQPIKELRDGYIIFEPMQGARGLLETVTRYNGKRHAFWVSKLTGQNTLELIKAFENKTLTLEHAREILNT